MRPLDTDDVRRYLCADAAGPVARARWNPVLEVLGTAAPTGQALVTPLTVSLARFIYNPRPGELAAALREPAELLDSDLADREAVESLLFDAFIHAAYRREPSGHARKAEKWLVFLARHLERNIAGPDLAWWQLLVAIRGFASVFGVLVGVVVTALVVFGMMALSVPVSISFSIFSGGLGVFAGGFAGFRASEARALKPARGISWQPPGLGAVAYMTVIGVLAGVAVGALAGVGAGVLALALAVLVGVMSWAFEKTGARLDRSPTASPSAVLAQDRGTGIVLSVVTGLGGAVVAAYSAALIPRVVARAGIVHSMFAKVGVIPWTVVAGIAAVFGALTAVVVGLARFSTVAWPWYELARSWLALLRRLPWPLMGFLEDAHRRGVLRQAGAVYQFRHVQLQHRLATRPTDRYAKAIEQLGSDELDVRIRAIHALKRIARESLIDQRNVKQSLAAFIRERSREQRSPLGSDEPGTTALPWTTRPDVQAAITVVGRRNIRRDEELRKLHGMDFVRRLDADRRWQPLDLHGADLPHANLTAASLGYADLAGADLTGADLTRAYLFGADLAGADLIGADLTRAYLSGADLTGADLTGADLTRADLSSANLTGADLTGSYLGEAILKRSILTSAILTGATFTAAFLSEEIPVPEGWIRDSESARLRRANRDADGSGN